MKKLGYLRSPIAAVVVLIPLALFIAGLNFSWSVAAQSPRSAQRLAAEDADREAKQSRLKSRFSSMHPAEFREALAELAELDELGALNVWQAALNVSDAELQKQAWREYQEARTRLERKQFVPQIARIQASPDQIARLTGSTGLEFTVWASNDNETIAAAPAYLLERLRGAGYEAQPLYDSIVEWQQARAQGDQLAQAITPEYLSGQSESQSEVRIAVVDLARQSAPDAGYSNWPGDSENILMLNDSFIAFLDIFPSDGSSASINSRMEERYARRGFRLAGFYTPNEFSRAVGRFFPGKTFSAGRGSRERSSEIVPFALAEGKYHNYEETLDEFTALANANPELARLVKIGSSFEGRQIFALKISRNASADDPSKPDALITGCHHAREWISVEPPVYFANQLIKGYATDNTIKYLLDNLQIWIVPILNPDGLTFSQSSPNDQMGGTRLWRKNRRPISVPGCGKNTGVDLNRNYDYKWRLDGDAPCPSLKDDVGASDDLSEDTYRGPAPESEPEVKAISAFMKDPNRRFRAHLDYHNFSELVLYPWGYQSGSAPDSELLTSLSKRMAGAITSVNREVYRPQQAIKLYSTTGSSLDYAYAISRVPAPFVIEMRPTCCDFNIPESQIPAINEENWAGARVVLNWAAGPPILESVKAYQAASDGSLSKLVYSARWSETAGLSGGLRQLTIDTRFPRLEPGRLQIRLQFSKPMDATSAPVATIGRDNKLDEIAFEAADGTQGWQDSVYPSDTWVGEAVIPQDDNQISAWRLAVSAIDTVTLKLDASPDTLASYATGTGKWRNYESSDGAGSEGGADIQHVLAPTLRSDRLSIFVGSPNGGERLAGGDAYTVAWTIPKDAGFKPVEQEVWMSTDGGVNYAPIVQQIEGSAEKVLIIIPRAATARARIRVLSREGSVGNTLFGDSQTNFTIGANVGSGIDVSFLSSELLSLNWSDASPGEVAGEASGPSRLAINLKLTNRSGTPVINPFLRVEELNRGAVLLTRDSKSNPAFGARQSISAGGDNLLAPGEMVEARLIIGLVSKKKITFAVAVYGAPVDGVIAPSDPVEVWKGKPRSK